MRFMYYILQHKTRQKLKEMQRLLNLLVLFCVPSHGFFENLNVNRYLFREFEGKKKLSAESDEIIGKWPIFLPANFSTDEFSTNKVITIFHRIDSSILDYHRCETIFIQSKDIKQSLLFISSKTEQKTAFCQ